jgi:hypothetical protein
VALAHSSGILAYVFEPALLRARSDRIDTMVRMADVSGCTDDAIEGARTVVGILSAAATATATSR